MIRPRQREPGPNRRRYGPALSLGTNIAAGMLGLTFAGYYLDRRFGEGEGETFTLIGLFLGLVYSGYEVWKVVRWLQREGEEE